VPTEIAAETAARLGREHEVAHPGSRIEDTLLARGLGDGAKLALADGEFAWSYATLVRRAAGVAASLGGAGVAPGDRVCIYLDRTPACVAALYGAWLAGAVAVPVNEGLRSRQVAHIVRHSECALFVSDERKLSRLDTEALGGSATLVLGAEPPEAEPRASEGTGRPAGGDEPAAILYTSGSTGRPKGILLSHENLRAGVRIVARYLGVRPDERLLAVLPFSFDYGLNQLLTAVAQGASLHLQRSPFPPDVCRTLERERITAMAAVPPLWSQLMEGRSPFPQQAFPALRYITSSGGVFPVDLVRRYRAHLPHVRIYLMYGLSEAFRSTFLPPEEIDRRPGSMGRAIPETELLVLDEQGMACAPDQVGELVHRGPTVALGYWRDPEATRAVFRPDPEAPSSGRKAVFSGDLVRRDGDGFFYFVSRRDQLIKTQGYRVSPDEVEELLLASGLLSEAVVGPKPDRGAGALLVAHLVPRDPEHFAERELLAWCRREMPSYLVPAELRVHAALPRTPSGKLDRKALVS
jgi:acyl-CoA ligase (AMP-forming) (exosortase A-associated)